MEDGWEESRTRWGEGGVRVVGIPTEFQVHIPHDPKSPVEGRRLYIGSLARNSRVDLMRAFADKARTLNVGLVGIAFNWHATLPEGFCHLVFATEECARKAIGHFTKRREWHWMNANPHARHGPEVKLSNEERTPYVRPVFG